MAECSFQKSQEVGQQSAPESGDQQVVANKEMDIWSVYVDGSSAQEGARAGILLIGLDKEEFKCFIKFTFLITNNAVEYEALLPGLRLATKI